jgi:hypothetical protein
MDFTTKLSTVNAMLATIGEAPVNTLEAPLTDVAVALASISEVTRLVLADGYAFNTDDDYPFYPNETAPNEIIIPREAMNIRPTVDFQQIVQRGNRLYDRTLRTYEFTVGSPVLCRVIWNMDFDDLPDTTRQYVAVRAARLFQGRAVGSPVLHQFAEIDEREARLIHLRHNVKARRKNFLTSGFVASLTQR